MKAPLLLLLAVLCYNNISAQTTLKTEQYHGFKETYYVLKADTNIKQGPYKMARTYDSVLVCSGFYKNNLKDSTWSYYSYSTLAETGFYKEDKRIGIWTVYNHGGKVEMKYDYSNNKLLDHRLSEIDSSAYKVFVRDKPQFSILQRVPIYLDGTDLLYTVVGRNIRYPETAKENNIKGKVIVTFKIDSAGHVSDYQIFKHLQKDCDNEAIRVVKLIPENWLPAILDGKPVSVEYMIPITFALAD